MIGEIIKACTVVADYHNKPLSMKTAKEPYTSSTVEHTSLLCSGPHFSLDSPSHPHTSTHQSLHLPHQPCLSCIHSNELFTIPKSTLTS